MNRTRQSIRLLVMMLLVLGGMVNEAWAATKTVTYHVITLPFGDENTTDGTTYRIEAIKMKVTCDTDDPIELPELLRSPLMETSAYSYYKKTDVTITSQVQIFKNNGSKYDTFTIDDSKKLSSGAKVLALGDETDIYVTYVWRGTDAHKTDYGKELALDGSKIYNIELSSYTGSGSWLYALNLDESRGNRLQAIPYSDIYDDADLGSEGIIKIKQDNVPYLNEERRNYNFTWKFLNDDPYNIILESAYTGDYTYYELVGNTKYWKRTENSRFYTRMDSKTDPDKNTWLSNEWRYAWPSTTKADAYEEKILLPGWFRNDSKPLGRSNDIFPSGNKVHNNLLFSFSLLGHSSGNNYTLVASWVNVNGNDWVPGTDTNNKGQYLHMMHTPHPKNGWKYPGPTFKPFNNADQVQIHEVRDYTFKVKTPLSKTVLEVPVKWSDYAKESSLKDHYPTALKRKYTQITGAYKEEGLTTEMATFEDVFKDDEPFVNKNRDIWLKYKVSESIPFKASGTTATLGDLKWYNIYLNKEEKYTVWYDKTDGNKFNTVEGTSGHTKYAHESHFAFIGDPYELYVVSRLASEDNSNTFYYLKLGNTAEAPLGAGIFNAFNPVPSGTKLIAGSTYYTSATGGGKFIAAGTESATGSNYYQKVYTAVPNGTDLNSGSSYYTSSSGGGMFEAGSPTVAAADNQYYVRTFSSIPITENLVAGDIYYTTAVGEGRFKALGTENTKETNYYKEVYVKVLAGTTLTPGCVYYTSAEGKGPFVASYTGTANGSNFYTKSFQAVSNGTTLTAGGIYYTSYTGDEQFIATGNETVVENSHYDEANVWEIVYDDDLGNYGGCFRLRKFKSYDNPVTIGWNASDKRPLDGNGPDNSTEARLSVLELPMMYYTYYIVDKSKHIAVMATEEQVTGTVLNYNAIPEVIRSPFLYGGNLTFHTYKSSSLATLGEGMTVDLTSDSFEEITFTNSEEGTANEYKNHIFVSYTDLPALTQYPLMNDDDEGHSFNVILNNEYIYYDSGTGTIKSKANFNAQGDSPGSGENLWVLGGEDPYAMSIRNKGATKYVHVDNWATGTFTWVDQEENTLLPTIPAAATRFIIKSSTTEDAYEVMATTSVVKGSDSKIDVEHSVDASTLYYNFGRPDATTVQMYDNGTYAHGYAQIRFQLKKSTASSVTYHLIDIARKELLIETARHVVGDAPRIPPEIFSPLVGYENYTYWKNASTNQETKIVTCSNSYVENERFVESVPKDVWITYNDNGLVDMNHTTMYLLKYEMGDQFRQEDGSDGLLDDPKDFTGSSAEKKALYQAVYPYCNGDGNFFVYGQTQYDIQQEGAASSRNRFAWYLESGNNDPYHVKILSRNTELYDGIDRSAYFATRTFSDYNNGETVVTALVWPNISGVRATEYMVLGNVGQYQLVTTPVDIDKDGDYLDAGEDTRHVVNSFEQYWKTYNTIKKKLLSDLLPLCEEKERTDRTDGSIEVPTQPPLLRERLTKKKSEGGLYEFHSYEKMAKAQRWNGYNAEGEKAKGWETREHWFQTVNMGAGYFDLIPTTIDPALILLDQHGWEIMRKPLPSGPDDPNKAHKYEVLAQYDSPMVKEYIFWASAKKRSEFHQYYLLDKRIGGSDFSSTSLTSLPAWGSENVLDSKGNHNDHYVTYIVKDEYASTYTPSTKVGAEFLVRQGNDLAMKGATDNKVSFVPTPGSAPQYIINNINSLSNELWYVKPNADIDTEMGYTATNHNWGTTNPNAYEDPAYSTKQVAEIITNADDVTKYGRFSFSNGFDPYNIQISSKNGAQYFTTGMIGGEVSEGIMIGKYGSKTVTLADKNTTPVLGDGYQSSQWAMTNQTFMAVQDADGNMQLMPRFDHNLRMRDFTQLVTPTAESADPDKLFETQTQLYRPFVYNYRIIDNEGRESLRYQSGGDLLPYTPDHFKSPLAKDFKYYKDLTYDESNKTYIEVKNKTDISDKEITSSLAGAGLTTPKVNNNNYIYVRYAYDEEADAQHVLLGKWLSMTLNEQDAIYYSGSGIVKGTSKPSPVNGDIDRAWQWKFLKHPYLAPDPYAVQLFSRLENEKDKPMSTNIKEETLEETLEGKTVTTRSNGCYQRFALLSHTEEKGSGVITDGYALAVAGTENYSDYYFLDGRGLAEGISTAAITAKESGFKSATCSFDAKKSKILLTDDVDNTYHYYVYTNGGVPAIDAEQSQYNAQENNFVPKLPDEIKTPLLNYNQFRYYEALTDTAYNSGKAITNLYGLYDGKIYVRYNAYDPSVSEYKVPNHRNEPSGSDPVAKGDKSNDAPLRLDNTLPHNIIWYNDVMMKVNGTGTGIETNTSTGNILDQPLQPVGAYEWTFEGNDPYAIKIRHKGTTSSNKYVHAQTTCSNCGGDGKVDTPETTCTTCGGSGFGLTCDLNTTPTTFMLLNKDEYEYGVFATTGYRRFMLSEYGNKLVDAEADTPTPPNKFIIFSLGTLQVIYHLVLANIGNHEAIPYRDDVKYNDIDNDNNGTIDYPKSDNWNAVDGRFIDVWNYPNDTIWIHGTTQRDLTTRKSGGNVDGEEYQLGETITTYPSLDGSSTGNKTYCKNVGPVSLGDGLTVPDEFYRPNVNYFFIVHDIQKQDGGTWKSDDILNKKYKGLQLNSKEMSMQEDLIGKTIYINIVYGFNQDLESNSGDDFVLSINQNKWYTLETVIGGKTYLAQYTNAWGFELKEGRGSHYTNDFLWTPIGDPYGFQLMNRYMDVNSGDYNLGEKTKAITTYTREASNAVYYTQEEIDAAQVGDPAYGKTTSDIKTPAVSAADFWEGQQIVMGDYTKHEGTETNRTVVPGKSAKFLTPADIKTKSIYELLEGNTPGYFRFHPVANNSGAQYYFNPEWADDNGDGTVEYLIRHKTSSVDFTFGLSVELFKPYFDRAGYVGGLTKAAYNNSENAALVAEMKKDNPELTAAQLMQAQELVYNSENVVQLKNGYYRLHSPLGISGIDPARYASGYLHKIESTDYDCNPNEDADGDKNKAVDILPMHFYEEYSDRQRQFTDFKEGGFTSSHATRGDITVPLVEKDPASIFYFEKINDDEIPSAVDPSDYDRYNLGTISTQGLYVKGKKGIAYDRAKSEEITANVEENGERPAAVMTADKSEASKLFVMDLGGGVLLIHDNVTDLGRRYLKYLSYDYSLDTEEHSTIYDLKLTNHTHTDHAKWCMQPVQDTDTKGINEMGLKIDLKQDKGNNYYYASFCAPFDVLLTDAKKDTAYICRVWNEEIIHLKKVGKYNTQANGCPVKYQGCHQFVPAGTPVIIRSKNATVTMALPTREPSTDLANNYKKSKAEGGIGNIFLGEYLEQLLPQVATNEYDIYTFGYPMTAKKVTEEKDQSGNLTGVITFDQQLKEESGMGFYINATPNRESAADMGSWIRNNRYVYGNKVYYRVSSSGGGARQDTRSPEFIPVVFDDDEDEDEPIEESLRQQVFNGCVYDLQGRCVATEEMVKDGTWRSNLKRGIYILNGKKVYVK